MLDALLNEVLIGLIALGVVVSGVYAVMLLIALFTPEPKSPPDWEDEL